MDGLLFVVLLLLFVWLGWGVGICGVSWVGLSEKDSRPPIGRYPEMELDEDTAGAWTLFDLSPHPLYTLYHDAMLYFTIHLALNSVILAGVVKVSTIS